MKKLLYDITCKIIEKNNCSVVPNEVLEKSVDMLKRAYTFYLTSNREESESAYIQGVVNMAKNFIGEDRVKSILNKICEVNIYE